MSPVNFPKSNSTFGPPPDLTEQQVNTVHAFTGVVDGGSLDGMPMVVVAWKPDEQDLEILKRGGAIYLAVMGGLPPHVLTTEFPTRIG